MKGGYRAFARWLTDQGIPRTHSAVSQAVGAGLIPRDLVSREGILDFEAARDAWRRTLDWFSTHLTGADPSGR